MADQLTATEVSKMALEAYTQVWRDNHIGFCPPPGQLRDKKWSRFLREVWPECTTIRLDETTRSNVGVSHSDKMKWCKEQKLSNFWNNGGGNVWYFERRDIAALFKLQFGGDSK